MIITCPECATRYNVEDDRFLPDGHSVRCTNCGVSWFVPAPEAL
ncbi:MAG: zinc-ribbon domain-containing protein, partial [Pseudomonadota bacterium]